MTGAELVGAIRKLYPGAGVTGWGGRSRPDESAQGVMLSVNGVDLAVLNLSKAAPVGAFDGGNQPDFCWQNARDDLKRHQSHMFVIEAGTGDVSRSMRRACAVTIVIDAISVVRPMMGLSWETAKNLVRGDHFAKLMPGFRAGNQAPVGLWIRLLAAYKPPAPAGAAGTYGLHCFGSPNIEIHARRLGYADGLSAALSYAEERLRTGRPTWNEATTALQNGATFRIERLANGVFGVGAVAKLVEVDDRGAAPAAGEFVDAARVFRTVEDSLPPGTAFYSKLMRDGVGRIRNSLYEQLGLTGSDS